MARDRGKWKVHIPSTFHPIIDGKMRILKKSGDDDDALRSLGGMTYFRSKVI